jgi:hypothetical protein
MNSAGGWSRGAPSSDALDAEFNRLARLEQALQIVSADLRATGLTGPARLVVNDSGEPSDAFVEFGGSFGHGNGIAPGNGGNLRDALLSVADDLQDAVMDSLLTVWPVCPSHQLGAHPRETSGEPVWWCNGGDDGHVRDLHAGHSPSTAGITWLPITSRGAISHTFATAPIAAWKPISASLPSWSMTSLAFSPFSPTSKMK